MLLPAFANAEIAKNKAAGPDLVSTVSYLNIIETLEKRPRTT
jgi:hypothetical protein